MFFVVVVVVCTLQIFAALFAAHSRVNLKASLLFLPSSNEPNTRSPEDTLRKVRTRERQVSRQGMARYSLGPAGLGGSQFPASETIGPNLSSELDGISGSKLCNLCRLSQLTSCTGHYKQESPPFSSPFLDDIFVTSRIDALLDSCLITSSAANIRTKWKLTLSVTGLALLIAGLASRLAGPNQFRIVEKASWFLCRGPPPRTRNHG